MNLLLDMLLFPSISGVAYSKHIVHLYSYHGSDDVKNYREVCVAIKSYCHAVTS